MIGCKTLQKTLETMQPKDKSVHTTYKEKAELSVSGYVRSQIKRVNGLNVPREIIQLILLFYLLKIENEMVFDKDNKGADVDVISDYKIRFGKMSNFSKPYTAARLCYGISLDKSKYRNIESISWKVKLSTGSFSNCMPFIGVVSNRTSDFDTNPFIPSTILIDAYGISASQCRIYDPQRKAKDHPSGYLVVDDNYPGLARGNWVTVKYMIHESKLVFENLCQEKSYELKLPNDIDGITEWYPAIGLRYIDDECEIKDIIVN